MIELTSEQRRALASEQPPRLIDPETRKKYVLVREEVYDRMKELAYDDSPWTEEEMDQLAQEAGELLDREFLAYCEMQADDTVSLDTVRQALAKIPGTLSEDIRAERDEG